MINPDVSIVIPCYNEETTIKQCITDSKKICKEKNISFEIIVVDNNSSDSSYKIAQKAGAKVVRERKQGYGHAYKKGFETAKGKYIFMADADNTYDFKEISRFYNETKKGYDFVIGNRFNKHMEKGGMPKLHKYIGNPFLSGLINILFHNNIKDTQCGARLIKKTTYEDLKLQSKGMEFASEMIIKAVKRKIKIKQLNIKYYARKGESKLNSWKDGWRHLRFILMMNPNATYIIPGSILTILGMIIFGLLMFQPLKIGNIIFHVHPLFLGSLCLIFGTQLLFIGYFLKILSIAYFKERNRTHQKIQKKITLEKGLFIGGLIIFASLTWSIAIISKWIESGLPEINEIKTGILLLTITAIGIQIIINSFYFYTIKAMNEEQI